MKYIGRILGWILLGTNLLVAGMLLLSAYSPAIVPTDYPVASCAGLAFPAFLFLNLLFFLFWLVVCRRYALLPVLATLACAGAVHTYLPLRLWSDEPPAGALKILTYNTMGFAHGMPHTAEHPNPVLQYLAESDADIICLQEYVVGGRRLKQKDIDYALRAYPYKHYHKISDGSNGLGCYSRYPILSATPVGYDSRGNGSVAYRLKVGGDTLLVVNNHLESNKLTAEDKEVYREMVKDPDKKKVSAGSRLLVRKLADASAIRAPQADAVARVVDDWQGKGSVIVCGDFNDSPLSYAHHRITACGLDDAFVESGTGAGISYHQNGFYFRIDHILLSKDLTAYRCTVDRSIRSSDHYPVWCYVARRGGSW